MLTVISPAKKLDFEGVPLKHDATEPAYQADAYSLSRTARRLSVAKLQKLMSISPALAKLNQARFKDFAEAPTPEQVKPAALAFNGDTYTGLHADTLSADDLAYAQNHLRILSGLYGLLRPMDNIQPYRLEMGSRLATRRGKTLYQYWGTRIAEAINEVESNTLLNCASVEYFSAVKPEALTPQVITPVFMELRDGKAKIVSFFAKKARGMMARYVVQNQIDTAEDIKSFTHGGYCFQPADSTPTKLIFTRAYPDTTP
ncbi:MAG: peroxide stress protein YaaA [Rhodobacteraceae bacterium]|nr:peroxide stress protein YaaA [Paracoccaceae bacterium]